MPGFVRTILIGLDAVIFTILEQIFMLIRNLASFELFSPGVLDEFTKRVYLILGLVMVFKLMLSFIQMLIDPDKMEDKENGVVNILKRVVISMILIVLVPGIFSFAKKLQLELINIIPKVVVGVDINVNNVDTDATTSTPFTYNEDEEGNVEVDTGKLMAYYSFLPFFYYNEGCEGLGTLNGTTSEKNQANVKIYSVVDAVGHVNDKSVCSATDDGYDYNYRYLISTAVGIFLGYVLVTVALKIAIRTIKFGLCELIAPIPIASYIDPKSSKKAFDNWVSTSIKVYLDLFTRLIVVYFIIYIFKVLFDNEKFLETLGKYGPFQGLLVGLFIITGLLYFAKEMPKFISNMLGVPDGFSDIGDMFKGQGWKALGTTIGGAAGLAAQPLSSAITNYKTARKMGEGKGTALRRAFNSGVGGVFRSGRAFVNNEGFAGTYTKAHQTSLSNTIRRVNIANDKRREKSEKIDKKFAQEMLKERYSKLFGGADFESDYHEYENNQKIVSSRKKDIDTYTDKLKLLQKQRDAYNAQGNSAAAALVNERMKQINRIRSAAISELGDAQVSIDDFENNRLKKLENSLGSIDYKKYIGNYTKDIQHAPGTISGAVSGAYNTFVGNPVPTSKDYSTGKSLMDQGTSIFKSFAEEVDVSSSKVDKSERFTNSGPRSFDLSYSEFMAKYKQSVASGSDVIINGHNFTAAEMSEFHKNFQKQATIRFANDLYSGKIQDQKRKDMVDQLVVNIGRQLNLSQSDMRTVESQMQSNMGKFLADADDKAKSYAMTATEMEGRERLQQESKKSGS